MHAIHQGIRLKRSTYAVSLALASLVAHTALAQEGAAQSAAPAAVPAAAPTPAPAQTDESTNNAPTGKRSDNTVDNSIQQVVVSTRKSQQSSIARKKNAATAMDSIVAEDVGSLPDSNVGEAISRMAGIALDRGDFGEGVSVAVRGNGPDLTRVEIDGQGVQSAGGTDANGGGGRGVEFRQLSADLIKSVDVVKGSTADMTEGSLGGGIIIKTRTGLDFKEPFASVRISGTKTSLTDKWEPDTNVILSHKFFDNKVGVIVNASKETLDNEAHQIQVATSGNQGYARILDLDNSPNKTFTFNPATLNMADPTSTQPTQTLPYNTGGGSYTTATPLAILTQSANAKTKADCYTAFPQLSTTSASIANLSSTNRTTAINTRSNELATCLNQWNDYTPSLIRNIIKREIDKRQDLDLRADWKVTNDLTLYAKGSYEKRKIDNNTLTYGLGGVSVNPSGSFTDTAGVRAVSTTPLGAGYYLNPNTVSYVSNQPAVVGAVSNVIPGSVTVDDSHHVTQFGITNATASTDQVHTVSETINKYFQLGGTYQHEGLTAEFFIGDAKSGFTREDKRTTFNYNYGTATLTALPSGLWGYSLPAGFNQTNPANYLALAQPAASAAVTGGGNNIASIPAYTLAQQPMLTQAPQLTYTPQQRSTEERTAKLDLSYALPDSVPFFKRVKTGFNLRDTIYEAYTGGGLTVTAAQGTNPAVVVPAAYIRSSLVGCQDTAGSLGAGGNACQYGYVPSNLYASANSGQVVVTPAQFQNIIAQSLTGNATETSFFNGAANAPSGLVNNWTQIDVDKVFALSGVPNINMNCLITCVGSDGKTYQQPVSRIKERSDAFYLMTDFELDHLPFSGRSLPFGMTFDGNVGWRYIRTTENGVGTMSFSSITKTAAFDPNNANAAAGINTITVTANTPVHAAVHDFLPIYNFNLWAIPDQVVLRYNRARTLARPPVSYLLPAGTCINDERLSDGQNDVSQRCTSTVGNPLLQAQKNLNQNWSAEWYPSKDTNFSLAYFKQKGIVGAALTQGVAGGSLLGGSSLLDPTGKSLDELKFDYTTYINGVPTTRTGWEFGMKTAFTFLPWYLRYTGMDANYTKLESVTSTQNIVDLLTNDPLPPMNESKFTYNWALWYDDGRLSARVAVQGVGDKFLCIAACTANSLNNYPNAYGNGRPLAWNPGSPNFRDATRYVDAKISYWVTKNMQVFLEGRNLGNATTSDSQGQYVPFSSGAPSILSYNYGGRTIATGINFRFGG